MIFFQTLYFVYAKKYNLLLFEDCTHAHGALYKRRIVGTHYSDAAAWSLQGKKLRALFPSYKKKRRLFSRLNFNFPNAYLFHKRVIRLPIWYGENRKEYVYYALRNAVNKFKK